MLDGIVYMLPGAREGVLCRGCWGGGAFKAYILSVCRFPGNQTLDLGLSTYSLSIFYFLFIEYNYKIKRKL